MSEPTDVYISKHSGGVLEGGLIAIDAVFRHFLNLLAVEPLKMILHIRNPSMVGIIPFEEAFIFQTNLGAFIKF